MGKKWSDENSRERGQLCHAMEIMNTAEYWLNTNQIIHIYSETPISVPPTVADVSWFKFPILINKSSEIQSIRKKSAAWNRIFSLFPLYSRFYYQVLPQPHRTSSHISIFNYMYLFLNNDTAVQRICGPCGPLTWRFEIFRSGPFKGIGKI